MRLLPTSRRSPAAEAEAARARVSAIGKRTGWVPRVPGRVRDVTASAMPPSGGERRPAGRHARRDVPVDETVGLAESLAEWDWSAAAAEGSLATDPHPDRPEPEPDATSLANGAAAPPGVGRPIPGAVAERLPLPVRALIEGLPAGVRHGRFGLQTGHAAVVVLVILLGLAVTALAVGWGRPRIATAEPGAPATVLATGAPIVAHGHEYGHDGNDGQGESVGEPEQPGVVVVHVAGEVAAPGIVELPAGSRVVDAIEAAGGGASGVDLSTLNLARILTDGEQISVGVEPAPDAAPGGPGAAGPGAGPGAVVNLNTATADQLATLPGIGPALAARILQWRDQNGRFTAVEELLEVSGIGPAKMEALVGLVTL